MPHASLVDVPEGRSVQEEIMKYLTALAAISFLVIALNFLVSRRESKASKKRGQNHGH